MSEHLNIVINMQAAKSLRKFVETSIALQTGCAKQLSLLLNVELVYVFDATCAFKNAIDLSAKGVRFKWNGSKAAVLSESAQTAFGTDPNAFVQASPLDLRSLLVTDNIGVYIAQPKREYLTPEMEATRGTCVQVIR